MRRLITATAVATAVMTAPGVAADESKAQWLFVQSADGVELVDDTTLVFPVEREIFAFTDRPYRKHHYLNAHEFAALWNASKDSFENDPPNAVLTWVADGEVHEAEIELMEVAVGDFGRSIVYGVDIESAESLPEDARRVSLFVDGMTAEEFCAQANLVCSGS